MKPAAPESVARRILGLDPRTSVYVNEDAVKSAFRGRVKDPVAAGWSVDELLFARDLMVHEIRKRAPKEGAAAGWAFADKQAPRVIDRASVRRKNFGIRNARVLAAVEVEFEKRKQRSEDLRKRDSWTRNDPWWQKTEDEHFTTLALDARLVCTGCLHPFRRRLYLLASSRGVYQWLCPDCYRARKRKDETGTIKWKRKEQPLGRCHCSIDLVLSYEDYWDHPFAYHRPFRMRTCGASWCQQQERNKLARERRQRKRRLWCRDCGEQFTATRAKSRYCSNTCRQRAYRKRKLVAA
jgi:hypothetical protein